jgi:hypothetical protein
MTTGYRDGNDRGVYRKETGWTENGGKVWEPAGIEGYYKADKDDDFFTPYSPLCSGL